MGEVARAAAGLDEVERAGPSEFFVERGEVAGEGRGEEGAAFGARAVVAGAAPAREVSAAVVAVALVVEGGLHPVSESDGAGASDALAQSRGERGSMKFFCLA